MPNFSKILEEDLHNAALINVEDGKIYSLPRIEEMGLSLQNPNLLFLNKAWTQKAMIPCCYGLTSDD
jgi:putative aldouronate transport system substrate-binding protein